LASKESDKNSYEKEILKIFNQSNRTNNFGEFVKQLKRQNLFVHMEGRNKEEKLQSAMDYWNKRRGKIKVCPPWRGKGIIRG